MLYAVIVKVFTQNIAAGVRLSQLGYIDQLSLRYSEHIGAKHTLIGAAGQEHGPLAVLQKACKGRGY